MVSYDGLFNKEYFGEKLNENHFVSKALHFRIIKNGTILPHVALAGAPGGFGGLVDDNGNFIKRSAIHMGVGDAYTPNDEVPYSPDTVIYLGFFLHVWGHCLTDNLKRIWFLKSDTYKRFFKKIPICYIPTQKWGGVIAKNFAKLLQILEVDINRLYPIVKPIKFQNIILPDESFFLNESKITYGKEKFFIDGSHDNFNGNDGAFFSREYIDTVDRIRDWELKNFIPIKQKKFYFVYGKKQIGEERIAQYFNSKGYAIVQPEKLSLEEQLNIFANCESFASLAGSVSHNVIFLKDNSNVILIPRRAAFLNIYQQALNQIHDLDISYIDSAMSLFAQDWTGYFCYIVSENLRKHFGDEITEKYTDADFKTFINYSNYAKSQRLREIPQELIYFENILPEFMEQLKEYVRSKA